MASPALPGMFLCFAAMVLLVFVSVSSPTWEAISFLNVGPKNNQIRYGVFGFTGSQRSIGYSFSDSRVNSTALENLTKALILHPIVAGMSGLALLLGLSKSRVGTVFMSLVTGLAALVTLVAWVIDLALFGIARQRFRDDGQLAQYGNANWLTLGALVALLLGFCASACGIFGRYRTRRNAY